MNPRTEGTGIDGVLVTGTGVGVSWCVEVLVNDIKQTWHAPSSLSLLHHHTFAVSNFLQDVVQGLDSPSLEHLLVLSLKYSFYLALCTEKYSLHHNAILHLSLG